MEDKTVCPHYNAGYCKFKEKCHKTHPKDDCTSKDCRRKGCGKRHRRICRYLNECRRFQQNNDCEYKHTAEDSDTTKKLAEALKIITKYKAEVEDLKGEIIQLKFEVKNKKLELDKMQIKDREIASLEEELTKMAEEINQLKHAKAMDSEAVFKCDQCPFVSSTRALLKSHTETKHVINDCLSQFKFSPSISTKQELVCTKCQYVAKTKVMLTMHIDVQHGAFRIQT
jgi:hypothetical protein